MCYIIPQSRCVFYLKPTNGAVLENHEFCIWQERSDFISFASDIVAVGSCDFSSLWIFLGFISFVSNVSKRVKRVGLWI